MDGEALPDLLRYQDLADRKITRHELDRRVELGEYERISPGIFLRANTTDDTTAAWIAIATKRPTATLCLLTALALHDLTDEIPRGSDIAIPRGTHPITTEHGTIRWHRFSAATFAIGRTEHRLPGGTTIGLYSAERTLIDLFRLRHEWGSDLAVTALKRWLRIRGNTAGALLSMADSFPKSRPALRNTLEILL